MIYYITFLFLFFFFLDCLPLFFFRITFIISFNWEQVPIVWSKFYLTLVYNLINSLLFENIVLKKKRNLPLKRHSGEFSKLAWLLFKCSSYCRLASFFSLVFVFISGTFTAKFLLVRSEYSSVRSELQYFFKDF